MSDAGFYDNDSYAKEVLPVIIVLGVLMIVGLFGNSLVCCVYLRKFQPSTTRCFIMSLSVFDLLMCLVGIPFHIMQLRFRFSDDMCPHCCSVLTTVNRFISIASGTTLSVVAVDRFRKICQPFKKQVSIFLAKITIIGCCMLAVAFAVPAGFIYDSKAVPLGDNRTGTICDIVEINWPWPLVYHGMLSGVFVTESIVITTLYILIWRALSHQNRYRKGLSPPKGAFSQRPALTEENQESCTSVNEECPASSDKPLERSEKNDNKETTGQSGRTGVKVGKKPTTMRTKRQKLGFQKTLMFFVITIVFGLSYLPYLGLRTATILNPDLINNTHMDTDGYLVPYNLFYRSTFINCAANPVIYSFFSTKFRRELRIMVKKM